MLFFKRAWFSRRFVGEMRSCPAAASWQERTIITPGSCQHKCLGASRVCSITSYMYLVELGVPAHVVSDFFTPIPSVRPGQCRSDFARLHWSQYWPLLSSACTPPNFPHILHQEQCVSTISKHRARRRRSDENRGQAVLWYAEVKHNLNSIFLRLFFVEYMDIVALNYVRAPGPF